MTNLNADPENRAGVVAPGDLLLVTLSRIWLSARDPCPEAQRTGRRLTGEDIIGASAR